MESRVRRVDPAVSCTVDTSRVLDRAVLRVRSACERVGGRVYIIGVDWRVMSRAADLRAVVRVTLFCRADIAASDSAVNRAFHSVPSAIARSDRC